MRTAAARPRCMGLDSRRAHGSPSARGGPGSWTIGEAAPRPSATRARRRLRAGARGTPRGRARAPRRCRPPAHPRHRAGRVTPPSQRSISSLSSSPAVHTAGTPAQKQSSSRVRKEKFDSRWSRWVETMQSALQQPGRALRVRDGLVVEEHEPVERTQPLGERSRGARLSRARGRCRRAANMNTSRARGQRSAAFTVAGYRRARVEPVPDAAVPQHDLGVLADRREARPSGRLPPTRCGGSDGDAERHLLEKRAKRRVGRIRGGVNQARGEQRADVEVALAPAAADEVVAGVERREEVVERDRVPEQLLLARRRRLRLEDVERQRVAEVVDDPGLRCAQPGSRRRGSAGA